MRTLPVKNLMRLMAVLAVSVGAQADAGDLRARNEGGVEAARSGDPLALAHALDAGASANARDETGQTLLMLAITAGHQVTERLVQRGLGAEVVVEGLPAPRVTPVRLEAIRLLLARGADPDALDREERTPLTFAVERDYAGVAEVLLASGAHPDGTFPSGLPAVSLAAVRGYDETLRVLIEAGAAIDAPGAKGKLPLHYAAEANNVAAIEILLEHDTPVDAPARQSWTALQIAASRGHEETVALLLANGADPTYQSLRGMTAETLARARGHQAIAEGLAALRIQHSGAGS